MTETSKKASGDTATRRPRVMPDVTKALASDIFSGRYPAGSSLPTENELGVEYGVSRTVIREALKVLAAKGLVLSRPRIGTVVCEQDNWNIIDPQVLAWHAPHALDDKLFDAILETRRAIEPLVAELAATRATLQEIADLEAAWRGMANAGEDLVTFSRSDITFHQIVYAASHNPIFRQIGNLIDTGLKFSLEATATDFARPAHGSGRGAPRGGGGAAHARCRGGACGGRPNPRPCGARPRQRQETQEQLRPA